MNDDTFNKLFEALTDAQDNIVRLTRAVTTVEVRARMIERQLANITVKSKTCLDHSRTYLYGAGVPQFVWCSNCGALGDLTDNTWRLPRQ